MKLKLYLVTLLLYTSLGLLWFLLIGHRFQRLQFGNLLPGSLNFVLAGVFYLIALAGFYYLVVELFLRQGSVTGAAIAGAIVGLISSAADSWAGFSSGWPLWFILTYIVWSSIMTAVTAAITVGVGKKLK
jgi:uncharacterized membrane protein